MKIDQPMYDVDCYIYVLNMECIKCKYNAYNKIKLDRKLELSDT